MPKFDIERMVASKKKFDEEGKEISEAKTAVPAEGSEPQQETPPAPEEEELETVEPPEPIIINKLQVDWQDDEYDTNQVAHDFYDFIYDDKKLNMLLDKVRTQFERLWKIADKQAKKKYKEYTYEDIIEVISSHVRDMDVDEITPVDVFFVNV